MIKSLTGIRWYAAFAVYLAHQYHFDYFDLNERYASLIKLLGPSGVTLFFVLSGFVMFLNYPPGDCNTKKFYIARIARIYPLYFIGILLCLPMEIAAGKTSDLIGVLAAQLTMVHGFIPAWSGRLNDVAWTLSVEAFFYLLFPLILYGSIVLKRQVTFFVVAALSFLSLTVFITYHFNLNYEVAERVPVFRLGEFVLGIAAAAVLKRMEAGELSLRMTLTRWLKPSLFIFLQCLVLFLVYFELISRDIYLPITSVVCCCYIASLYVHEKWMGRESVFLTSKAAILGGEISYAFYLLHNIVLRYAANGAEKVWGVDFAVIPLWMRLLLSISVFCFVVILCLLSWRYFEKPSRDWVKKTLSSDWMGSRKSKGEACG